LAVKARSDVFFHRAKEACFSLLWLIKPVLSYYLRYAILTVADVGYGLLFSPWVNVNEIRKCAFCDGRD
jgi:hypothetical protein